MFASMTAWICSLFPAVMLEIVQHASLRMPFFAELSKFSSQGNALKLMITCSVGKDTRQKQDATVVAFVEEQSRYTTSTFSWTTRNRKRSSES